MPLLRRGSVRRRLVRGGGRGRRRMGYTRGRGIGLRTRRMALRIAPRSESKYFDFAGQLALSNIALRSSGLASSLDATEYYFPINAGRVTAALLTNIAQGPAVNQRIGNRVFLRRFRANVLLNAAQLIGTKTFDADQLAGINDNFGQVTESGGNVSAAGAPFVTPQKYIRTTFRFVILRDRMVSLNASVPAAPVPPSIDDIFEVGGGVFTLANLNVQSLGRYQLLYDRKFTCDSDDPQRSLSLSIPIGAPAHFGGAGGTDIREGAIYFVCFALSGGLNSSLIGAKFHAPSIIWTGRTQYTDR